VNNGEKRRKERVVRLQSDRISSDTQLGTTTYSGKVTGTVGEITVQAEKMVHEPKACLLLLYPPYTFTQDGKKVVSNEGDVETHTITTADPS
jgi:lipopolysaccharide export system protein LptA